jgi:hypothetical protein
MRFSGLAAVGAGVMVFLLAGYAGPGLFAGNASSGFRASSSGMKAYAGKSGGSSQDAFGSGQDEGYKTIQARAADAFVDSMGVNVHMEYTSTPYGNYNEINERLTALGMRHVRDEINDTSDGNFVTELKTMKSRGYTVDGLIEGGNDYPTVGQTLEAKYVVPMIANLLPSIDAVEGPNEPDDQTVPPFQYGIDRLLYPYGAINESEALWSIVRGSSDSKVNQLPIVVMSEGTASDFETLAEITPPPTDYANYGNMHAYQGGSVGDSGLTSDPGYIHYSQLLTGDKPLWTTEMGYHNYTAYQTEDQPGVSERASAIYLPIAFLSGFQLNVMRTFSYELVDEAQDPPLTSCSSGDQDRCSTQGYYGLLYSNWKPKPAYTALQNLITVLQDPGSAGFTPGSLDIEFSGAPQTMEYTLLEKSKGDYYLAIWNDVSVYDVATGPKSPGKDVYPPDVPMTISFENPQAFTVYAPNDASGTNPTGAYTIWTKRDSIRINLPPEALLIKIAPPTNAE